MEEINVIRSLSALAHEARLRVFRALVVAGHHGLTPSDLVDKLSIAPNTLSFHLKELSNAELVSQERQGRSVLYRAAIPTMNNLLAYLTENCCEGVACMPMQAFTPNPLTTVSVNTMTEMTKPLNILFLCTHNSARSILAEALLNDMSPLRFKAYSAGSSPRDNQQPNPLGLHVLQNAGVSTEGLRSKSWDEFATPDAPQMDLIITVCDNAAGEVCPIWPGHPATAHWGYPDPSEGEGTDEEKLEAFKQTMFMIRRRLEILTNLPHEKLQMSALQSTADELARL